MELLWSQKGGWFGFIWILKQTNGVRKKVSETEVDLHPYSTLIFAMKLLKLGRNIVLDLIDSSGS